MSRDGARLLEKHLPDIERVTSWVCRRRGLEGDEADEFRSWVLIRFVEDDYQILRSFRGDSRIRTYLTVVVNRLYLDYRTARWGKWRPSAAARRMGTLAVELERLLVRDRRPFDDAVRTLRSRREIDLSDREIAEIASLFPERTPRRAVRLSPEVIGSVPSDERSDDAVQREEAERRRGELVSSLGEALDALAPEDHLIVKLKFFEGLTVASVARRLDVPQKPLYRRLHRLLGDLRAALERNGVRAAEVAAILGVAPPIDPLDPPHTDMESDSVRSVHSEEAS